jgi:hypothetical protein
MEQEKINKAFDYCLKCIDSCVHPENIITAKSLIQRFNEHTKKFELGDYLYFRLSMIEKLQCFDDYVL